ncbi:hypothetical protein JXB22_00825 [candidate division WOR-3 bacterium]|nr:hypothetical protein [candidate division WOR-3 bacterium]
MRILHFALENIQDVPGLLCRSHTMFGDDGFLVTMIPSRLGFPDGVCLRYPLLNSGFVRIARQIGKRSNVNVAVHELKGKIKGETLLERAFFHARDLWWGYSLHKAWRRYDLDGFDIYHFDGDIPFLYGERILKKLTGKRIVTHFFGSELRKFGMNPYLKERADLKITSELDHRKIDPSLFFVPIPYTIEGLCPRKEENTLLRVGHSPTRRSAKGTPDIIRAVERLQKRIKFEFVLIEGVLHDRCMEIKRTCDIGIDQIGNYAGTGYGRSGLEFLALGIPTITEIPHEYEPLLPGHPFVNANLKNFEDVLARLLADRAYRQEKREQGLTWVREFPDPRRILGEIYSQYHRLGWT